MINNKKGFLARDWVVAFVVFTAVVGLLYLMVFGLATNYNEPGVINDQFNNTYNKFDDLSGDIDTMYSATTNNTGLTVVGTYTTLFSATFTVISLIFDTLTLPGAMLKQFAIDANVPSIVANILFVLPLVVLVIIIIMVVISSITQRKL